MRPSGRAPDQLRKVSLEPGFSRHAEGSCLVKFGDTHVLCTASVEEKPPAWLRNTGKGWVTAEYGMLPRSTHTRTDREAAKGKQTGRTQEIQRLIGRALRAATDLQIMGERQVRRLPVVENDRLVGIVSLGDIAVKEGKDSRTGDTLENISEGVKH